MLKTWKSAMTIALACSLAVWFAIPAWGVIDVSFTQLDPVNFPIIECYMLVTDETGNAVKGLDASDFSVTEQSNLEEAPTVEDPVDIRTIAGYAGISVALVFDRSGSMEGQKIERAKQAAKQFVSLLKEEDKAALIPFSDGVVISQVFTHQKGALVSTIDSLTEGGGTSLFDALYIGLQECGKVPGVKVIIAFTDGIENRSHHSLSDVLTLAADVNVPIYTIGLGTDADVDLLGNIAGQTHGLYKFSPTASDLLEIYDSIGRLSRDQYLVTYTTHNPNYDGTTRTVTISVAALGLVEEDSRIYLVEPVASAPVIENVQLWTDGISVPWQTMNTSLYAGQALDITADIRDNVGVQEAKLFYRITQGEDTYHELCMHETSEDTYEVTLPGTMIKDPGLDFYITASDGTLTSTSPVNSPTLFPHQIAVLPNHFPTITHTPVTHARVETAIAIEAEITDMDAGDYVNQAWVYYRQGGHILYDRVRMENTSDDNYEASIPQQIVTTKDVDYYIMAADTHGVRTYNGTDIAPHYIDVREEVLGEGVEMDLYDAGEIMVGMFINTLATKVTGLHIEFDREVTIVNKVELGGYLPAPEVMTETSFDFVGGELAAGGVVELDWKPVEASPVFVQWISETSTSEVESNVSDRPILSFQTKYLRNDKDRRIATFDLHSAGMGPHELPKVAFALKNNYKAFYIVSLYGYDSKSFYLAPTATEPGYAYTESALTITAARAGDDFICYARIQIDRALNSIHYLSKAVLGASSAQLSIALKQAMSGTLPTGVWDAGVFTKAFLLYVRKHPDDVVAMASKSGVTITRIGVLQCLKAIDVVQKTANLIDFIDMVWRYPKLNDIEIRVITD